jgi:hypothetical protein
MKTWYIAIVRAVKFEDNIFGSIEVVRLGPFTINQLEPIFKKLIYRKGGSIRIFQNNWEDQSLI